MLRLVDRLRQSLSDRYDIVRELGRGGMAVVFLAKDLKHDRMVAIKVLRPELAESLTTERFLREIRIAAGLAHPHVLAVFDSGAADEDLYYVAPFVDGESLRDRIDRAGRLPVDEAVGIACDVLSALAYAHARGIVHRDIKPDNILLAGSEAVVADFGIARAIEQAVDQRITQGGIALGTGLYMAPEQAAGNSEPRSDIYSVGCTLYEMLTGKTPFVHENAVGLVAEHAKTHVPSLRAERPDVSPALESIVQKSLAKNAAHRYATAEEFRNALRPASGEIVAARPPRRLTRRVMLAGAGVVVALGAVVAYTARERFRASDLVPHDIVVFPFRVQGSIDTSIVSPDGLAELLYTRLPGDGGPRAIDPRAVMKAWQDEGLDVAGRPSLEQLQRAARRLRAGQMLVGEAFGGQGRFELRGRVYSVGSGEVVSELRTQGTGASILTAIDDLAGQLLIRESIDDRRKLSDMLTNQLPALRAYLRGLARYRRGQYSAAADDFTEAIKIDSTFALAAMELSTAMRLAGNIVGDERKALSIAWTQRSRLTPRDSAYLVKLVGPRYPLPSSTADQLRQLDTIPNFLTERWETSFYLGDLLFHEGPFVGVAGAHGLARNLFRQTLAADSALAPALEHLIELGIAARDTAEVRRWSAMYLRADSLGDNVPYIRWRLANFWGDAAEQARARQAFGTATTVTLRRIVATSQLEGTAVEDGLLAASELRRRARTEVDLYVEATGHRDLLISLGRPAEAVRASLDNPLTLGLPVEPYFRVADAAFWDGDSAFAANAASGRAPYVRAALALPAPPPSPAVPLMDVCAVALWRMHVNDTTDVERSIRTLRAYPNPFDRVSTTYLPICADILETELATRLGRSTERVVFHLDSLIRSGLMTNPRIKFAANLTLARVYERRGELPRALAAVRRRPYDYAGQGPPGLSRMLREEGRLAALVGDTTGAIKAYRHYLALRAKPEASVALEVAAVRAALAKIQR